MTIPPQPLHLFAPAYADPIDPSSQVDRLPGTDAPCLCDRETCGWPFCLPTEIGECGLTVEPESE